MSYIAARLSGVLRIRPMTIGRIGVRRSSIYTTNSNLFAVTTKNNLPGVWFNCNQYLHQIDCYSTTGVSSNAFHRPMSKILSKLSSNKASLQFNKLTKIRKGLFRNYNISLEDGFEILKSCSQLLDHTADERIQLINETWNELLSMIEAPTKDQLVLLLRAYRRAGLKSLENHRTFFEKFNCPIDDEIFAELMYITCQNGETMENAEALLKDFVAHGVEPNEKVYNALILGYSKHGIEAFEKVVETMKSKNIKPSLDTNTELIKAYLTNGNSDKAMELLQASTAHTTDQLFDIIRCAAIRGNDVITKTALNLLPETIRNAKSIIPTLQNICVELVHLNRHRALDAKLDPYQLIIRHLPVIEKEENSEYGIFVLKEMIATNESVSNVLQFCDDLIESERNLYAINACCMYTLVLKLPKARDFLEALAAKEPLRPHYFWPLLIQANNQTEVIDVIKFANKLNVIIDTITLQKYVLPRVNTLVNSQETVQALTAVGVRMLELKVALITFLLNKNRPKEALDIAIRSTSTIDASVILPALSKFIRSSNYKRNTHTIAVLIKKLHSRCSDKFFDLAGQTVLEICDAKDKFNEFELTKQLLMDYERAEVKISPNSAELILDKVSRNRKIYPEISTIIQKLTTGERLPDTHFEDKPLKNDTEIEALEQQIIEYQTNGFPTQGLLYRLFLKTVQLEQYDRALEVKKMCDQGGVLETPAMLSTLLKLYTATNNADKALEVLKTLQNKHSVFNVDSYKLIDLATLLISEFRIEDAQRFIEDLPPTKDKRNSYISSNIWHLLNTASEFSVKNCNDENMAGKFLNILAKKGYCDVSNKLLGTVVKEYLDKKDIRAAVAAFESFVKQHKKTPQSVSLLIILIELSNEENDSEFSVSREESIKLLQHVIELMKGVHESENVNVNIILAFACAGNEQQLRKILMNPAVKFNGDRLLKDLEYLKSRNKIKAVVAVARSAKGLQHTALNEEKMYEFLLGDFVRTNDYESALQLYEELQQDDSTLISKKFHRTLVDLLEKNNQPLPQKLKIKTN